MIGQRLRELREGHPERVSQETLGKRLGRNQRWISERERESVTTTVEEALEIIRGLGFAAELVVLPAEHAPLLAALAHLDPAASSVAARLAEAWPHVPEPVRRVIRAVVDQAEEAAREERARRPA